MRKTVGKKYDIVVVGGGISGVCAAVAAARHGAFTALIQNRPMLGGNASSEIRMHICGADCHGTRPNARETGILEEICLENKRMNPNHCFSVFDMVLWEKTHYQKGLDLYLNTHFTEVITMRDSIRSIIAVQLTTEKTFQIEAKIFIDATGDGTLGHISGAEYMMGREGRSVFGEMHALEKSDHYTMGNTLMFKAVDMGIPIKFEKPSWANIYNEDNLEYRNHSEITSGYWWIELGGGRLDTISDSEEIRDELLKAVYGVWDHVKNRGEHGADNLDLDWVQFLPGKRESRRLIGDYILKEQDLLEGKGFEDAVAYGGWPMDMHVMEGLANSSRGPTHFIDLKDIYTIPYRCLYSRNIKNLMLAGRAISVSHMSFGSTRVMGTTSVIGQAVGTAAAMAIGKNALPADILRQVNELQQCLLKDDCFIPGCKNEDKNDLARGAKVSCSSSMKGYECENIINGFARRIKGSSNCWVSDVMSGSRKEWLSIEFHNHIQPKEINFRFDSNLSKEIMISLSHRHINNQVSGLPPEMVKYYSIEFYKDGELVHIEDIKENYLRNRSHIMDRKIMCNRIKLVIQSTYGDINARVFEIRVY